MKKSAIRIELETRLEREETENMHLRRILTQPYTNFNKDKYLSKIVYFPQTGQTSILTRYIDNGITNIVFLGDEFELKKLNENLGCSDIETQEFKAYLYNLIWEINRIKIEKDNEKNNY